MTTNKELAKRFARDFPKTNYHMQTALVAISKLYKMSHIDVESQKFKKIAGDIILNLECVLECSTFEGIMTKNVKTKDDVCHAMLDIINIYEEIYPNWKKEYSFMRNQFAIDSDFILTKSELIQNIANFTNENSSLSKDGELTTIRERLKFSNEDYKQLELLNKDPEKYLREHLKDKKDSPSENIKDYFWWILIVVFFVGAWYFMRSI